jgi:hypothetical protein
LPAGDRAELVAFNDEDFGFARLTVDQNKQRVIGEFFAAYSESRDTSELPALSDSFTLDLRAHALV